MIPKIIYKTIEGGILKPVEQNYDIAIYTRQTANYIFKHNIKEIVYAIDEDTNRIGVCRNMEEVDEFYSNSAVGNSL